MPDAPLHPATLLAHAGCPPDDPAGAVTASPVFATTFERAPDGSYPGGHVYARASNPTRTLLEATLAALEAGGAAAAFGSGMAAVHAVLAPLPVGARVLYPADVYHGVRTLLASTFAGRLDATPVDFADPAAADAALADGAALVWLETPSNPLVRVTDLRAVADRAHAAGAVVVVDNTWPTPLLTRPLDHGADLVVHSLTKYLAGHSDVLGGCVVGRGEDGPFAAVRHHQTTAGAVLDPFSCWLTLRGLRTLAVRLERACATAADVAGFLDGHPAVAAVHYPGLAAHPGHETAARQMQLDGRPCFGGMLSVEVAGGEAAARRVANALRVFRQATSLGGTESLVEHRRSVEPPDSATPPGLLRLSVGLEHPGDLLADLDAALG